MLHILYHSNKTKQCGLTPNLQDYNFLEWGLNSLCNRNKKKFHKQGNKSLSEGTK